MLQRAVGMGETLKEKRWEKALLMMKRYDAEFDMEALTYETEEIFKEFYCNYLTGNKQYLELVCGETVSPLLKAMIDMREKEGWRFKFEEFLDCSQAFF